MQRSTPKRLFLSAGLYLALIAGLNLGGLLLAAAWLPDRAALLPVAWALALLSVLVTLWGFPRFRRLVEARLLGAEPPPPNLLEAYTTRLSSSLTLAGVVHVLRREILPELRIRQSALLRCDADDPPVALYAQQVTDAELPGPDDVAALVAQGGAVRPPGSGPCPWARLCLPLRAGDELLGLWLLGRRDPDDAYPADDLQLLAALAGETAIALSYIVQAERLRALHWSNIDRHERERARLARALHDEVLNELASAMQADGAPLEALERHRWLAQRLREIIADLRPAMLTYGLAIALEGLTDELSDRRDRGAPVAYAVAADPVPYPQAVEEHVYRIVQQAIDNALRHGGGVPVRVHGRLAAGEIDLIVEDAGAGFDAGPSLDLTRLLSDQHFGLAGMLERATLIDAALEIDSRPGQGTRVRLRWSGEDEQDAGVAAAARAMPAAQPAGRRP